MDIKVRTAQKINSDLYREMLNNIKILDTQRIVNEGTIDYQCDYYTIYYHQGSKCIGLYNVVHCSCYGTEDDEPDTFANDKLEIVDTIEDFYKKCINNDDLSVMYSRELCESYINWFEDNFYNDGDGNGDITKRCKIIQKKKLKEKRLQLEHVVYQERLELKEEKLIFEEKFGISCSICQKKKLKEDMYQTKDNFECISHSKVNKIKALG